MKPRIRACGPKPNGVSSQSEKNSPSYIPPLKAQDMEALWSQLPSILKAMGFELEKAEGDYLHFTACSTFFRFVDDMEFQLNREEGFIEIRSQSRVGYSDLGVNRRRLERIRRALKSF